jgi:hypothetical protein
MANVKHSFHYIIIDSLRHVSQYAFDNQIIFNQLIVILHIASTTIDQMHNHRLQLNF